MGLFTQLLTLPLAPVRGTAWVAQVLHEEAERQLYDEAAIRRELIELELAFERGELAADERDEREQRLIERLEVARERAWAAQQELAELQAAEPAGAWEADTHAEAVHDPHAHAWADHLPVEEERGG